MPKIEYAKDLDISVEDFESCGYKEILDSIEKSTYAHMYEAFKRAEKAACEENSFTKAKVLGLFSNACSMMLVCRDKNRPFMPLIQAGDRCSAIPETFTDKDLDFLEQIVEKIDHPLLRARIADLLWVRKRRVNYAMIAIKAYMDTSLDDQTWASCGIDVWRRAAQLGRMIKDSANTEYREIEERLKDAIRNSTIEQLFFGVQIARILRDQYNTKPYAEEIGNALENLAIQFSENNNIQASQQYFVETIEWFKRSDNPSKSTQLAISLADRYESEGDAFMSCDPPQGIAAGPAYRQAIKTLKKVPVKDRGIHNIDHTLDSLGQKLTSAGLSTLTGMVNVGGPKIDLGSEIENSRKKVRNKKAIDAIAAFIFLFDWYQVGQQKVIIEERMRQYPISTLITTEYFSQDGRMIAQQNGYLPGDSKEVYDKAISSLLFRDYCALINLNVHGRILPANETLMLEHNFKETDFINIAHHSSIVPDNRHILVGKGLYSGFIGDYRTALHLLVPQLEHIVRSILKDKRVITTTIDQQGIENEVGLSALIEKSELLDSFGENVIFEIKALFCDAMGPNLRNEVAHGLVDDNSSSGVDAAYAWWFILKLVYINFYYRIRKPEQTEDKITDDDK